MNGYRDLMETMDRICTGEMHRLREVINSSLLDPNLTRSLAADFSITDRVASTAIAELAAAVSATATNSIVAATSATAASLSGKLGADYCALSEAVAERVRLLDAQQQTLCATLPDHFAASETVLKRLRKLGEPLLDASLRAQDVYAEQHALADAFRDQYLALDHYIERSLPLLDWKQLTGA